MVDVRPWPAAVMGIRDASFATRAASAFDGESEDRPYCSAVLSIVGLVARAVSDAFEGAFERGLGMREGRAIWPAMCGMIPCP